MLALFALGFSVDICVFVCTWRHKRESGEAADSCMDEQAQTVGRSEQGLESV